MSDILIYSFWTPPPFLQMFLMYHFILNFFHKCERTILDPCDYPWGRDIDLLHCSICGNFVNKNRLSPKTWIKYIYIYIFLFKDFRHLLKISKVSKIANCPINYEAQGPFYSHCVLIALLVYWARCIDKGDLQGLALLARKIFFFQMDEEQGKKNPAYGRQRISRPIWIVAPITNKASTIRQKIPKTNPFLCGNFTLFIIKSCPIWDCFFPLLLPKDSEALQVLALRLQKVGAKRRLNSTSQVNKQTDRLSDTQTDILI